MESDFRVTKNFKNFIKSRKRNFQKRRDKSGKYTFLSNARINSVKKGDPYFFGKKQHDPKLERKKPSIPLLSHF